MKKLICKLFGHTLVEEYYVVRCGKKHFRVAHEVRCLRCGETIKFEMTEPMRRSTLLQEGWFIEEEKQ